MQDKLNQEHVSKIMYSLFVGGLPFTITEDELNTMFSEHGTISNIKIPLDRETNRSRGFAFVEFENDEEGKAAEAALNGTEVGGRTIQVNKARERR